MSQPVEQRIGSAEKWGMAGLILFAALLRVTFLGQDVVGGDEVHALGVLRGNSLGYILTHFHKPDNCIPITAWCWILANTVGLEEYGFRLWSWLPGIALVWVLPRVTRRYLGSGERLLLAAVLASSPVLIYWSREARPYSAIVLFGVLAMAATGRYAVDRRTRWIVASAVCQFVTFALSPTAVPFLAGLFLASVLGSLVATRRKEIGERLAQALRMFAPALLGLVLTLALLGQALPTLLETMGTGKPFYTDVTLHTWNRFFAIAYGFSMTGTRDPWRYLPILPLILTLWGIVSLGIRSRGAGIAALIVLLVPAIAYATSSFHGVGHAIVFVRYQAAIVPLYLVLMVVGFGDLRRRTNEHRARWSRPLLIGAFGVIAALTILGPLSTALPPSHPFGFRLSRLFRADSITDWKKPEFTPEPYKELAKAPPAVVVEWPSGPKEEATYAYYQALHHGSVIRCARPPRAKRSSGPSENLQFRTFSWDDELLERGLLSGTVVILHRQPAAEPTYLLSGRGPKRRPGPLNPIRGRFARRCREVLGPPFFEDRWVTAFRAP